MKRLDSDTRLAAEQVQIGLLRSATTARRVDIAAEMSQFAITGARAALQRLHPDLSATELDLMFVEQHYGQALATRLRALLASRTSNDLVS